MALLYITEYAAIAPSNEKNNNPSSLQIPQEPPLFVQTVSYTGTSGASAALQPGTKFVSIQLDTAGHIQFAASPVATTSTSRKHAADAVSFHGVNSGLKVAAITA